MIKFKDKEFKGSEGEFLRESNFVYALHEKDFRKQNRFFMSIQGNDQTEEEAEANARLFANSKKLLQAAIWAHQELEAAYSLTHWANPTFEKMIQDKLKQLETEILNSL